MTSTTTKALTLWQPWATFLIKGIKLHETRSWTTNYRGPILIHAAQRPINWNELNIEALQKIYPDIKDWDYPLGEIVGQVEIKRCRRVTAVGDYDKKTHIHIDRLSPLEKLVGNFAEGRFAWEIEHPIPLSIPNIKGKQGLWDFEKPNNSGFGGTHEPSP